MMWSMTMTLSDDGIKNVAAYIRTLPVESLLKKRRIPVRSAPFLWIIFLGWFDVDGLHNLFNVSAERSKLGGIPG